MCWREGGREGEGEREGKERGRDEDIHTVFSTRGSHSSETHRNFMNW